MANNEVSTSLPFSVEGMDEVIRQLQSLNNALEHNTDATKESNEQNTNALQTFHNLFGGLNQGLQVVQNLSGRFRALSEEYARQTDIMGNLAGGIDVASQRMNGLISNIDLMTLRNQIAATGLQLTDQQFANIAVAAKDFADRTGGDTTEAVNRLSEAIQNGNQRALHEFGINLQNVHGRTDAQGQALRILEQRFGSASASIDNAADAIDAMENRFENARTSFIQGFNDVSHLNQGFAELSEKLGVADNGFIDMMTDARTWGNIVSGVMNGLLNYVNRLIEYFQTAGQELNAFVHGDFQRATQLYEQRLAQGTRLSVSQAILDGIDDAARQAATSDQLAGLQQALRTTLGLATRQQPERHTGGARRQEQNNTGSETLEQITQEQLLQHLQETRYQYVLHAQDVSNQLNQRQKEILADQNLSYQERVELLEESLTATEQQANMERDFQEQNAAAVRQRAQEQIDLEKQKTEALAEQQAQQERMNQISQQFSNISVGIFNVLSSGHLKDKKARREAFADWMKNTGKQEAIQAIIMTAQAIGSFPNVPVMVAKLESATMHAGIAAALGGGGAALAKSAKGGGSSDTTPQTSPSGASGSSGSNQTQSIIINVGGQSLSTAADVGIAVQSALNAKNAKFGT